MDTKNPRGANARASVSIAPDTDSPSLNRPLIQPIDDLRALRAMVLIQRFSLTPETAAALALLAFNGGAG